MKPQAQRLHYINGPFDVKAFQEPPPRSMVLGNALDNRNTRLA